jgi:hypothetical protein
MHINISHNLASYISLHIPLYIQNSFNQMVLFLDTAILELHCGPSS